MDVSHLGTIIKWNFHISPETRLLLEAGELALFKKGTTVVYAAMCVPTTSSAFNVISSPLYKKKVADDKKAKDDELLEVARSFGNMKKVVPS